MKAKSPGIYYSNLSDTIFLPKKISKVREFLSRNYRLRKKLFFYFTFTLYVFLLISSISSISLAAWGEPAIVGKINSAFENIESWILKISTPAAAVAVGTGVFMKKFSFGDEEKIRTGKKIIKGSLFSYAFILAIDLILSAIKSLISWLGGLFGKYNRYSTNYFKYN